MHGSRDIRPQSFANVAKKVQKTPKSAILTNFLRAIKIQNLKFESSKLLYYSTVRQRIPWWPAVAGEWPAVADEWPAAAGEWPAVAGEWPAVAGEWPAAAGEWPATPEEITSHRKLN